MRFSVLVNAVCVCVLYCGCEPDVVVDALVALHPTHTHTHHTSQRIHIWPVWLAAVRHIWVQCERSAPIKPLRQVVTANSNFLHSFHTRPTERPTGWVVSSLTCQAWLWLQPLPVVHVMVLPSMLDIHINVCLLLANFSPFHQRPTWFAYIQKTRIVWTNGLSFARSFC